MTPEEYAATLASRLYTQVGAFFSNTHRGAPGTCVVCTGPATARMCPQCRHTHEAYGPDLADLVVPLAYAKGRMSPTHQSEHHVYSYKREPPAPKCVQDLDLMMLAGTWLHGSCIARLVGMWDVVTFVPSARWPGADHPVVGLARQVHSVYPRAARTVLEIGRCYAAEPRRVPRSDRFAVQAASRSVVMGRHVLVVDDTWVSGTKAQSAALALKAAGAAQVTILCVARWLRNDWPDHQEFINSLREPYDAMRCPVTGDVCPTG
jgi:hypothetical protein